MNSRLMLSCAFLLATAGYSAAADLAPTAQPVFSWSGPYVGAFGGAGWATFSPDGFDDINADGGLAGGFVGINYQMDNVVVGVEADIGRNWNEEEFGIPATVKTTVEGSVRERAGFAFDRALVYGTAGWTATKAEADVAGDTVSDTLSGYTVGAGLDYAVTDQVFARGEYRYNDFGTGNFGGGAADFDLDQNILTIGLGLKF